MKLALINAMEIGPYETNRLRDVADQKGHQLSVLSINDPLLCQSEEPTCMLSANGTHRLSDFDAALLKLGIAHFDTGQTIGVSFEALSIPCFNAPRALHLVRNKFLALSLLAQANLPIPRSLFMPSKKEVEQFFAPTQKTVIKTNQGSGGIGVFLAQNRAQIHAFQEYFDIKKEPYFVQDFIGDSFGEDIRVFVLGGQVLGAFRRKSQDPQEFRSNVFLGGRVKPITLTDAETEMALKAASVFGLSFAGVDLMRGKEQSYIIEVNGNPGFKGIELAYDICVPSQLFAFIENQIR